MSDTRHPRSLRARATLWYTASLVFALALFAGAVYVSLTQVLWAELDDRLHQEIEASEGLLQPYWTAAGLQIAAGQSPLDDDDERWLQVWSSSGVLQFESQAASADSVPSLDKPGRDAAKTARTRTGEYLRVKDEAGHIAGHPVVVRVATTESRVRMARTRMLVVMAFALPLCAVIAAYGCYRLVRRALSPIDRLVDAVKAVTATNLSRRLPFAGDRDEVGQIAGAFNETLARLEASFAQMERFTANASHELRTPLTAFQSTGQLVLSGARSIDDYRDAIGSMLEDAAHLSTLLDTLLLLAKSDAGQIALTLRSVELMPLVHAVTDECRVLADEKHQHIVISGSSPTIVADPTVLRIALANMLHNAIRYSPSGATIQIRVIAGAQGTQIEFEDTGPGIPLDHQARVFERFYRADAARSPGAGGVGLGLAMARWAVVAHGGTVGVRNNPLTGSTFTIQFPAPPQS